MPTRAIKNASSGPALPSTQENATQLANEHLRACVRVAPKGSYLYKSFILKSSPVLDYPLHKKILLKKSPFPKSRSNPRMFVLVQNKLIMKNHSMVKQVTSKLNPIADQIILLSYAKSRPKPIDYDQYPTH